MSIYYYNFYLNKIFEIINNHYIKEKRINQVKKLNIFDKL